MAANRHFYRPRRRRNLQLAYRIGLLVAAVVAVVLAATGSGWGLYIAACGLVATAFAPERKVSYRGKGAWDRVFIYFGLR